MIKFLKQLVSCLVPAPRKSLSDGFLKLLPKEKWRASSYFYDAKNGLLNVKWAQLDELRYYEVNPKQDLYFFDSPDLYMIMLFLPASPDGIQLEIDNVNYIIKPLKPIEQKTISIQNSAVTIEMN